jgi:pilus assembly protein Flp/PilA
MDEQVKWFYEESFMSKFITRFLKDESGATAIEYALIAAGISVIIIALMPIIQAKITAVWNAVQIPTSG